MDYQITLALLDAERLLLGPSYRYSEKEDVHILELGFLFGYLLIALKKKREGD